MCRANGMMQSGSAKPKPSPEHAASSSALPDREQQIVERDVADLLVNGPGDSPLDGARRVELRAILQEFIYRWHEASGDGDIVSWDSWASLLAPVEHYLGKPDLQTPRTTRYLLVRLMECVLRPFRGYIDKCRRRFWKHPLCLVLAVALLGVAGLRFSLWPVFWMPWLVLAYIAAMRFGHYLRLRRIARTGDVVLRRLASDDHAAEEVVRCVCDLEQRRVVIPTLVYSLLARLPTKPATKA